MRDRYPPIDPYETGFLKVSDIHTLYWELSGNSQGLPILFLHGGPGGSTDPSHRTFFDPDVYRIVLFDQRGCGKSTPHACLEENTTWDLVNDIEKLREALEIDKWIVFGGSWGSTLALAYAIGHPSRVKALIVRGIFLCRQEELDWFFKSGAHHLFPDFFEQFLAPIPLSERSDLIRAYYKRLTDSDPEVRKKAAKAWSEWEACALKIRFDPSLFKSFAEEHHADALARVECHYFLHKAFFKTDNWIVEQAHVLQNIPGVIIHGRYDIVCPLSNAWDLHKAWPQARLEIVPEAGHAASEPGITDALVRATDQFRGFL